LDNALTALEWFTNQVLQSSFYSGILYKNNSPHSLREHISANAALSEEIPEQVRWWEIRSPDSRYPEYLKCISTFFAAYLKFTQEHKILVRLISPDDNEKILLMDYRTRFSSSYKQKLKRKLSGIEFKRCTGLVVTTDMNLYREIISSTRGVERRSDTLIKRLRRELGRFHRMVEQYANGEISEQAMDEYMRECPFDLKYGVPPKPDELKYFKVLEFSLGDGKKKEGHEGHGSPHLHILLENVFFNVNGIRMIREALGDHSKIIHVRRYLNTSIVKYVLKYVKKAIVLNETRDGKRYFTNDMKKVVHASLYWITGCRMFSMSRTLQKEINKDNDKKEEKERKGEYVATVPKELRRKPYPYRDDCPDSIEEVLYYWSYGVEIWLRKVLFDDHKYWSSRIRHVWSMLVSEWKSG